MSDSSEEQRPTVTRAQLARRLCLSVSEIRRRERIGLLKHKGRGPKNQVLFTEEQVLEQRAIGKKNPTARSFFEAEASLERRNNEVPRTYNVPHAQAAFVAFREGMSQQDMVIKLGIHPLDVRMLAEDYARMEGGLFIGKEVLDRINKLSDVYGIDGNFPIYDGEDVYGIIDTLAKDSCKLCKRFSRTYCKRCVTRMVKKLGGTV